MSIVKNAKKINDLIFEQSSIYNNKINSFHYLISLYGDIYRFFSLKKEQKSFKYYNPYFKNLKSYITQFPIYFFANIYNLISLFFLSFRKNNIAIWSGDFYNKKTNGDFRLGNLINEFELKKIKYVELIRIKNVTYKRFFLNLLNRKKLVIYYDSLEFLSLFCNEKKVKIEVKDYDKQLNKFLTNFFSYHTRERFQYSLFIKLFEVLKINKLIVWEVSYRQIYLFLAAKKLNIKSIGFMHGFSFNTYMSYEHYSFYQGTKKLSPDMFIVWSQFWKEYFLKNSKNYPNIKAWGPLRNNQTKSKINQLDKFKNILILTEPLVNPISIYPYLQELIKTGKYSLIFKLRDLECSFYNDLLNIDKDFSKYETRISLFEDSLKNIDLVIGSHSTAVLESSIYNVPFLVLNTHKWGDYFELSSHYPNLFVNDTSEIIPKIEYLKKNKINLDFISSKYFGTNNSINKIIRWLEKN